MTHDTLLLRQIHPSFVQKGVVTSQAFVPTPKDESKLSVYNGDLVSAEQSYQHYTEILKQVSSGVMGVKVSECQATGLTPVADGVPFAEHAHIPFDGLSNGQFRKCGQKLRDFATRRGWQFQP